ncbi:MAG: hypothetical protein ACYDDF_15340 [Thermoplasmatota archaeon]
MAKQALPGSDGVMADDGDVKVTPFPTGSTWASAVAPTDAGSSEAEGPPVDMRRVKEAFRRLYPPGHPARRLVEAEPDVLPRREGLAKLEMVVRLLGALRERGS